jgi:hypothetical protein
LIRNRLECSGNRYTEEAHRLSYDILQAGGVKALAAVGREIPLPSRQGNIDFKPTGYNTSDLTDISLCNLRTHDWRKDHHIPYDEQVKAVLSVEAICFRPEVVGSDTGIVRMDLTGLSVGQNFYHVLTQERQTFLSFVRGGSDQVFHAAFVYQLQPLEPDLPCLVLLFQPAPRERPPCYSSKHEGS